MYTFERFHAEHRNLDGPASKVAFEALPEKLQDEAWTHLRQSLDKRRDRPKTDWRAIHDRLIQIEPSVYVHKLVGLEVEPHQTVCCPLADHEDDTASFRIFPESKRGWYCHGCNRGGSIYDFAGYLWNLPTRGEGFKQIQRQLMERFL